MICYCFINVLIIVYRFIYMDENKMFMFYRLEWEFF